jgi:hypothetical protein
MADLNAILYSTALRNPDIHRHCRVIGAWAVLSIFNASENAEALIVSASRVYDADGVGFFVMGIQLKRLLQFDKCRLDITVIEIRNAQLIMSSRLLDVFLRYRGAGAEYAGEQYSKGPFYYCILRVSLDPSH